MCLFFLPARSVFRCGCFFYCHTAEAGCWNVGHSREKPAQGTKFKLHKAGPSLLLQPGRKKKEKKKLIVFPIGLTQAPPRLFAQVGGQRSAAMLSLDEPLDLKLHRRPNGRDRGARSPPLSPLHAKRARQLFMADDGTAVIEPASPGSPHTGVYPRASLVGS